jgi:hypothetical protein
MEEVIEELSKIFESANAKQTELISSKLAEFSSEIQKQGNTTPQPVKLNTSEISHEIKAHLKGLNIRIDDSHLISALRQELSKHDSVLNQTKNEILNLRNSAQESIREIRNEKNQDVNVRLNLQNDFYGFTSWRPFALYFTLLSLAFTLTAYSWFRNSDNNQLVKANETISEFQKRVEDLRARNPKIAKKYFY